MLSTIMDFNQWYKINKHDLTDKDGNLIKREKIACKHCDGSGIFECKECAGNGQIDCPDCDGIGHIISKSGHKYDCKHCNGFGEIDCETCGADGKILCEECAGDGVLILTHKAQAEKIYKKQLQADKRLLEIWSKTQ